MRAEYRVLGPLEVLLDGTLMHSALVATSRSDPLRQPTSTPPPALGAVVLTFDPNTEADRWYAAERAVLGSAVTAACEAGFDGHAWRTVWAMRHFLLATGRRREGERLQRLALAAAQRAGDLEGQCRAHRGLVSLLVPEQKFDEAEEQLRAAVALDARVGNLIGLSNGLRGLAYLLGQQGKYADALYRVPLVRHEFEEDVACAFCPDHRLLVVAEFVVHDRSHGRWRRPPPAATTSSWPAWRHPSA